MSTLAELNCKTEEAFKAGLVAKETNDDDYIKALEALKLDKHVSKLKNHQVYEKVKSLGLMEVTILYTIEMMVGEKIKRIIQLREDGEHAHKLVTFDGYQNTEIHPEQISFETESGTFHKYQVGCPNYLNSKITYGVLLRMQELKEKGLFKCFFAIAPLSMWRPGEVVEKDPVIVASVELTDEDGRTHYRHFFVAQWNF